MLLNQELPSFEQPIEMLLACHDRMRRQCQTLQNIRDHLREHGFDAEVRKASQQVLRYFTIAAPQHHADEENDLFPLLRERVPDLEPALAALAKQHMALEHSWSELEPYLDGDITAADLERMLSLVDDFCASYKGHLDYEENMIFPQATKVLSEQDQLELGRRMARRHGA